LQRKQQTTLKLKKSFTFLLNRSIMKNIQRCLVPVKIFFICLSTILRCNQAVKYNHHDRYHSLSLPQPQLQSLSNDSSSSRVATKIHTGKTLQLTLDLQFNSLLLFYRHQPFCPFIALILSSTILIQRSNKL